MTMTLSETAKAALQQAIATKGPRKGLLKASAPPSGSMAYAAWQGAMMACNAYKVNIGGVMFMSQEQRAVFREVEAFCDALPRETRIKLDRDRAALESLGVW